MGEPNTKGPYFAINHDEKGIARLKPQTKNVETNEN